MTKRIKGFQRPKQNSAQKQHTKERGFNQVNFKKNTLEIRKYIVIVIAGRISMFKILVLSLLLVGCQSITIPSDYVYKEIQTRNFDIASWQKISNPSDVYKIYIEGDGYAFNAYGQPTQDPTPKGTLMRELAFGDKSPNVIYLARPCQYVKSPICTQRHWTSARFAPEVINSEYEAIKQIVGDSPIILIGFSGGAQIAGLVASAKNGLNVKKIITIAGNLDHESWTQYQKLPSLNESMNLADYRMRFDKIPQIHYVGTNDKVIPPILAKNFIGNKARIIMVQGATHNSGWETIYDNIRNEK